VGDCLVAEGSTQGLMLLSRRGSAWEAAGVVRRAWAGLVWLAVL